jgi:hypothetical protein
MTDKQQQPAPTEAKPRKPRKKYPTPAEKLKQRDEELRKIFAGSRAWFEAEKRARWAQDAPEETILPSHNQVFNGEFEIPAFEVQLPEPRMPGQVTQAANQASQPAPTPATGPRRTIVPMSPCDATPPATVLPGGPISTLPPCSVAMAVDPPR